MWAQAWSEPDAGSDMAAIRSRATPDGDEFVINGQKTWSTRAIYADWVFGLFRTDPDSKRHHGLSYMMVPLDAPGVTVRAIKALNGKEAFAEVFFDDVRIPAFNCIGDVGQGWAVAMATAGFERGLLLRSPARFQSTVKRLVDLYRKYAAEHGENGSLRDAVIECWMSAEAYAQSAYHTVSRIHKGATIGAESSINKIIWSELDLKMYETAMQMLGAYAELQPGSTDAVADGDWLEGFLFAQAGPIYAGTNEIQRNIIAERLLELPR